MARNLQKSHQAPSQSTQHVHGGAGQKTPVAAPYPPVMQPQGAWAGGGPGPRPSAGGGKPDAKGGKPPKKKRPASFYVSIAIAVIAIIVAAALVAAMLYEEPSNKRDSNALIGQIEGKSPEEIQAELDRIIQDGMFNISISSEVEFADGDSEGELRIENVPNNPYLMKVTITRNDTGEQIYESDIIEPNYHIQKAKLDKHLDAGTYECTATFHALDKETEEESGSAAAIMRIVVLN